MLGPTTHSKQVRLKMRRARSWGLFPVILVNGTASLWRARSPNLSSRGRPVVMAMPCITYKPNDAGVSTGGRTRSTVSFTRLSPTHAPCWAHAGGGRRMAWPPPRGGEAPAGCARRVVGSSATAVEACGANGGALRISAVSSLRVAATFISLIRFPDRAFTSARAPMVPIKAPRGGGERMEEMQ